MMTSWTADSLLRFLSSVCKVLRHLSSPCQPGEPSPSAESSHSPWEAPTITTRFLFQGWKAQVVLITLTEMSESTQLKRITHFIGHLFKPLDGCPMHASCHSAQSREQHPRGWCSSQPVQPWVMAGLRDRGSLPRYFPIQVHFLIHGFFLTLIYKSPRF